VDHVDPAKVTRFEEARRELLGVYASLGLREGTTTMIETKDEEERPMFLSIRPFGAYAEIDKLNDAAAARAAAIGKELDRLDAMTHATLVPPHANEIWVLESDLSRRAPGGPDETDAVAARLQEDEVAPTSMDEYEAASKGVVGVLARTASPLTRLTFSSSYGTGKIETLWLARRATDLDALSSGELAASIEKARALTLHSTTRIAFVRRELSSTR
jgi:hypothetical protein